MTCYIRCIDPEGHVAVMARIRRQGGAAVITIPPALLRLMNLEVGAEVELSIENGKLLAQAATRSRRRYSTAELLKGGSAMERLNAEVAWAREGDALGREIG